MKINLKKAARRTFTSSLLAASVLIGSAGIALATDVPAPSDTSSTGNNTTSSWDEKCSTVDNSKTCVEGSSSAASTVKSTAIAEATVNGRIVGEYLVSGGLTKTQVKGKRCSWMSGGYNSIRKSNGQIVKYKDTRKQYVCRTGKGPSGYQVSKCGNYYWPKGRTPSRTYRTVYSPVVIQSFNSWDLKVTQQVSTTSTSKSTSESWATCTNSSAYGYGSASAVSTASASVSFTARGRSQITAVGRQARVKHELSVNASAYAKASTSASTEASSKAKCTSTTPPPPPVQETPAITIAEKNDVEAGNSASFCFTYKVPGNNSAKVLLDSGKGAFATSEFTVTGLGRECTRWNAPSPNEVTQDYFETLTASIRDNGTGLSASTSGTIKVYVPAGHPN